MSMMNTATARNTKSSSLARSANSSAMQPNQPMPATRAKPRKSTAHFSKPLSDAFGFEQGRPVSRPPAGGGGRPRRRSLLAGAHPPDRPRSLGSSGGGGRYNKSQ